MRLIDADALIETLQNEPNYSIELPAYMWDAIEKLVNVHHKMVIDVIKKQPTAYSVEKVVAKLGEMKMRYFLTLANTGNEKLERAYDEVSNAINKAIQIVKDGGSDEP